MSAPLLLLITVYDFDLMKYRLWVSVCEEWWECQYGCSWFTKMHIWAQDTDLKHLTNSSWGTTSEELWVYLQWEYLSDKGMIPLPSQKATPPTHMQKETYIRQGSEKKVKVQ